MSASTTWVHIQKSVMEYMYTCEHMYVCKEVLSASVRKGTDICEFAQHGFTYKSIYDMIEGSLEIKFPTIWTDEKQSREEAERRERSEERKVEEKE